ncbi:MAG: hypothetical protein JW751_02710 [Polyangiaceae bacterium]|nr:hypothetical protein [Polyangiaceae bacterium]
MWPIPEEGLLDAVFVEASRVRVFDGGAFDFDPPRGEVAFELQGDDLRDLRRSIVVLGGGSAGKCRCRGDAALTLDRNGTTLGRIVVHHGVTIRLQTPHGDHWLDTGVGLISFLAERGLSAPLQAYEALEALKQSTAEPRRSWLVAAPPVLRLRLAALESGELALGAAFALLDPEYANIEDTAAALFDWIADHDAQWIASPELGAIGMDLLAMIPLEVLERAVLRAPEFADTLLGAARYFSTTGRTRVAALNTAARARIRHAGNDPGMVASNRELVASALGPPGVTVAPGTRVRWVRALGPVESLASDGQRPYAVAGKRLLRVESDALQEVHLAGDRLDERGNITVAASSDLVVIANSFVGKIWALRPPNPEPTVLAEQRGARDPVVVGGVGYWVANGAAERNVPAQTHIVTCAPGSAPKPLLAVAGSLSELGADGEHLYAIAADRETLVIRVARSGGAPETLAVLRGSPRPHANYPYPSLAIGPREIFFVVDERTIEAVNKRSGRQRIVGQAPTPVYRLAAAGEGLYALAQATESSRGSVLRFADEGDVTVVAEYDRLTRERAGLVIGDDFIAWSADERVFIAPRPRPLSL